MNHWLKWLALLTLSIAALVGLGPSGLLLSAETELAFEHRVEAPSAELHELLTSNEGVVRCWAQANEAMGEQFEIRHLGGLAPDPDDCGRPWLS